MDFSDQYINMCQKAVEIQKLFNDKETNYGDYFDACGNWSIASSKIRDSFIEGITWLPRQDQLQEMILQEKIEFDIDYYPEQNQWRYNTYKNLEAEYHSDFFNTAEQMYLAFLMKIKHNKQWNGQDWNKAKKNNTCLKNIPPKK